MDWYAVNRKGKKDWDTDSREYQRIHGRFDISRDNDGLEEYVYQEQERGVKGQS